MKKLSYCPMGPWPLYVGFTASRKAFAKEMRRFGHEGIDFLKSDHAQATAHFLVHEGVLTAIITMKRDKALSLEQAAASAAHEAVHIAQQLWLRIGETGPGAEAEAYLVQHITQFVIQQYFKTGRTRATQP